MVTVEKPDNARVAELFRSPLDGCRVLRLVGGTIGDDGALAVFRGVRDRPAIELVELDGNEIGGAGLVVLALLGDRVVPGRQRVRYDGPGLTVESFELVVQCRETSRLRGGWLVAIPAKAVAIPGRAGAVPGRAVPVPG